MKTDTNYAYNERDELTAEDLKARVNGNWQSTDAMGANRMSTFSYDNAQNRETASVLGAFDDPTPNALNQPNTRFGQTVTHDADGNMTSDGTWTYAYDGDGARQRADGHAARRARRAKRRRCPRSGRDARQNRLKSSSKTGLTITYAYDFMGRRVEMKSNFGSWAFTKRFIWDGWNLIADIWGPANNYALTCTYVWGIDVSGTVGGAGGVGGLALMYYNGRAFIPLQDGRGNIHGYLDTTTGKNAVSWDFTAYGESIHIRGGLSGQYGTHDFLFRYQSKMQDMEGHLLYFGHRFYHPGMGRFPNRDPIGEAGGLNLYGYVRNNPVNRRDYLGLNEDDIIVLQPFDVWGTSGTGRAGGFGGGGGGGFGGAPSDWDDGTNRNVEDPAKDGTGQQEEWKPTKENCDALRAGEYGYAFTRPNETVAPDGRKLTTGEALVAATIRSALYTTRHEREYGTTVELTMRGAFYVDPYPSMADRNFFVPRLTDYTVAITHSHAVGLATFRSVFGRHLTQEDYMAGAGVFSRGDVQWALPPLSMTLGLHTGDDRLMEISPFTEGKTEGVSHRGTNMRFAPPSTIFTRILECLRSNNEN